MYLYAIYGKKNMGQYILTYNYTTFPRKTYIGRDIRERGEKQNATFFS